MMRNFKNCVAPACLTTYDFYMSNKKSNLRYTRGITPKRVTTGGDHLRGLVPGQYSFEEISQ